MSLAADVEVRLAEFHEDVPLDVADGEVVAVLGPNARHGSAPSSPRGCAAPCRLRFAPVH